MYVLDTNTVIYYFKGLGRIKERLLLVPPSEIAVPSVVVFELEVGIGLSAQPSNRRSQLETLLSVVTVLPLDGAAAKRAAESAAALRKTGEPIGPMDTLIAGIAIAHGGTLITHNIREFRRVRGLRVEDWY
jgi:tRNA(fMet)-specific endonuclease VapC